MIKILLLQSTTWTGIAWLEPFIFYLLLLVALGVLINIFLKYRKFSKIIQNTRMFAPKVAKNLQALKIGEAIEVSKMYSVKSHLAKIVHDGLLEYKKYSRKYPKETALKFAKQSMDISVSILKAEYEKGVGFLDAIGRTAPFIGTLGGSAVTLTIGILIAIPAIWFAAYERNKSSQLATQMQNTVLELYQFLEIRIDVL
jgi:biopolymer transport protein ExbB/TolQ